MFILYEHILNTYLNVIGKTYGDSKVAYFRLSSLF
jgi:hypothetical protein